MPDDPGARARPESAAERRRSPTLWFMAILQTCPIEGWPPYLPPLERCSPLGGGWVGTTLLGTLAGGRQVVVKRSGFPAAIEADGLAALAQEMTRNEGAAA